MSYFASTIRAHLERQVSRLRSESTDGRKMIFMVPAMPEATMISVAEAVTSYGLQDPNLVTTLKIAANLTADWTAQGQQRVIDKGWADERGNLTYYRNLAETPGKCTLIVLCGADRVTDAAGLADFHTCDPDLVWNVDMRQSFKDWVQDKLRSSGFYDYTSDDLDTIDRIIKPLLTCGRGDLLQISEWLEALDMNQVSAIADIPRTMLANLHSFDVPILSRFPLGQKRKQLSLYINKSSEFYNYTLFLDARHRDKAIKAIDSLLELFERGEDSGLPLDDEDVCGPYVSEEEFLRGLRNYIESDDQDERDRLMKCDFVIIWDQILKFKIKESSKKKKGARKLSGSPVEVLLTATWMTLRDFFLENKGETELKIDAITINTHQFKHDVDGGDDREDNADLARTYLMRLIGGIDPLIVSHINLSNPDGSEIPVSSSLLAPDTTCKYSKNAEPSLEFSVEISTPFEPVKRLFRWRLPEHHMYRISVDLLKRAKDAIERLSNVHKLPVFHLSYFEELLQASADEEIRRVLLHSIRDERDNSNVLTNLLGGQWGQLNDPLVVKFKALAEKYDIFVGEAVSHGIFATMFGQQLTWTDLRQAYVDAFDAISTLDDINQSSMAGMLVRAFLIVGMRPLSLGDTWYADAHERSGVATILHPSVVEMLEAQVVYLFRCFNYVANRELGRTPGKDAFRPYVWKSYVDLSSIQSPLTGLLHNEDKNLSANVRGQELIHRIGSSDASDTPLSTRLLLRYNDSFDEESSSLSDSEMFRETSESKLLLRLMQDYFDLHPHARDGLSLAVFRNKDIQPVIAAVHEYLKMLANKPTAQNPNKRFVLNSERKRPYAISVTLFTESHDESDISSWVQQWKERWEAAETESRYELYRRCRFSIAHRIVEAEKEKLGLFQKLINEQFEADLAVLYSFVGAGEGVNSFEKVTPFDITRRDLKFPILEKSCCTVNNPAEMYRRKRVVSNRQFALNASHANLLHSLQSGTHQTGTIVVGAGDFTPWRGLLDSLHHKAEWIVCIDPNIDERLIKTPLLDAGKVREIIGFGSGVGSHGENNYTISTEQFSLTDIHTRLRASIQQLYAPGAGWSVGECEAVAEGVLTIAPQLSGLSLVRATGVGDEYIRDFMAYALSRKMLKAKEAPLCESLVSLDAYRHWFDLSDNMRRPDLMWMRVYTTPDQRMHIQMQLIECKLGQESSEHVHKAKSQIDNGLKVLSEAFSPQKNEAGIAGNEAERPDRRYWWMQLHRLVASKTEVERSRYPEVLAALERLAEGEFDISWSASVFAFWINGDNGVKRRGFWKTGDSPEVVANVYAIGGGYVRRLFTDPGVEPVDWEALGDQGEEIVEDGEIIPSAADDDDTVWEEDEPIDDSDDETSTESAGLTQEAEAEVVPEVSITLATPNSATIGGVDKLLTDPPVSAPAQCVNSPSEGIGDSPSGLEAGDEGTSSGRILLGKTIPNGQPIYWEFKHPGLANRHMLIFGSSGQGKTYAIQAMLCEMSKFRQNSLIIDYTNGFLPNHLEDVANKVLAPKQHVVRQEPLPINPFLPQVSDNGGIVIEENANAIAKRITGLFDSVYGIGNQQYSVLHRAIMDGVESMKCEMNLDHMLSVIESMADDKKYKAYAQSLHNKLRPFVLDKPFSSGEVGFDWDHLFLEQDPLCNIFQLAGMDMYSGRLITEFILWDLYGHLQSKGKKTDPKVIVLDEVQNLDHKEGSPLSKYLREGRKFGLSLILATQTMSNMRKDERDRMFNAEHKLFFRPADTELKAFAEIAALATRQKVDDWIRKLSSLSKGECYSIGRILDQAGERLVPRALKVRITALEERVFDE